tara:strand:- start:354 stop:551 length:198 start_codon:yes stop_codon:yes gene_type:complete
MTEEQRPLTLAEKAQQLILERQQLAIRLNEINGALSILDEIALSQSASVDEVEQEEEPVEIETEV